MGRRDDSDNSENINPKGNIRPSFYDSELEKTNLKRRGRQSPNFLLSSDSVNDEEKGIGKSKGGKSSGRGGGRISMGRELYVGYKEHEKTQNPDERYVFHPLSLSFFCLFLTRCKATPPRNRMVDGK